MREALVNRIHHVTDWALHRLSDVEEAANLASRLELLLGLHGALPSDRCMRHKQELGKVAILVWLRAVALGRPDQQLAAVFQGHKNHI